MNVTPMKDSQIVGRCMNDNINTNGGGDAVKSCEFKRGFCVTHKLKGDRRTITSKKWTKKKFGFGWVTSKQTVYSCSSGLGLPQLSENQLLSDGSQSPVQDIKGGPDISNTSFDLRSEVCQSKEIV